MDPGDDATLKLLQAARSGDDAALDELVRQHLPALRAFVRLKSSAGLRRKEECSDLVQTACRQALEHLDEYSWQGAGSFRNWLFSFAMHKILNREQHWRAAKRDAAREASEADERLREAYAAIATPSHVAVAREAVARLEAAMDRLPDDHREVVLAARVLGLSHREIAERMGRSEGAVRVLLSRALARLATLLGE